MNDIEHALTGMPEPELPPGLAATINARIAQADSPGTARAADPAPEAVRTVALRDRLAWAVALVGMAVGLVAQAYQLAVGEAGLNLLAPRVGGPTEASLQMLPVSPSVAAMALGLALYLAGFLAPQSSGGKARDERA